MSLSVVVHGVWTDPGSSSPIALPCVALFSTQVSSEPKMAAGVSAMTYVFQVLEIRKEEGIISNTLTILNLVCVCVAHVQVPVEMRCQTSLELESQVTVSY